MIRTFFLEAQSLLSGMGSLAYVGEDLGELDRDAVPSSLPLPCLLIEAHEARYEDSTGGARQGEAIALLRYADRPADGLLQEGASGQGFEALARLAEVERSLWELSGDSFSDLKRTRMTRVRRKDGLQEYEVEYRFSFVERDRVKPTHPLHTRLNVVQNPLQK